MLYVGGGVISSGATEELLRARRRCSTSPSPPRCMAMGAFPETHPLSLGMLGMHGTAYAN